jgi:hypothetical protein
VELLALSQEETRCILELHVVVVAVFTSQWHAIFLEMKMMTAIHFQRFWPLPALPPQSQIQGQVDYDLWVHTALIGSSSTQGSFFAHFMMSM